MDTIDAFLNRFGDHYGAAATFAAQAPGRLELLGNHTDYNQGFVLSCAVGLSTRFALRPAAGRSCRIVDFRSGEEMEFSLDELDAPPEINGAGYIRGVVVQLMNRGAEVPAFEAAIESDVPLSAGMSSSAALEISAALAIGSACGVELDVADWARLGRAVENDFFGLRSGLLDQLSSLCGEKDKLLLCDFRSESVTRTLPLAPGYAIVVVNSMKKHKLVDSAYNERRADCEHAAEVLGQLFPGASTLRDISLEELGSARSRLAWREYRRALHVVGECQRVLAGVRHLEEQDMQGFGRLWFDSHESSRMNFENSTPELDFLVSEAHSLGASGARLSGGGFGGITVHLVPEEKAPEYTERIVAAYRLHTGLEAQTLILHPGAGAEAWAL